MKYVVVNAENVVVSQGESNRLPDFPVPDGCRIVEVDHLPAWEPARQPPSYAELRRTAYPFMAEFLDAWVKNDTAALEAYRQKCLAVKAKYPKP